MPFNMVGQILSGITGAISSGVNTRQTNEANLQIARETNAANRQMVEMQNKAAKEEAELAYKRSSASNQVNLMRGAGMSRAGAINALNGGGSYTPAPVNVSQDSAPQMQTADFSAISNVAQAFAQRAQQKHDEKMQAKQLQAAKEQQQEQLESNERIAQMQADSSRYGADTSAKTAADRLSFDREKWNEEAKEIRVRIANIEENTNYTSAQRKHFEDLRPLLKSTSAEELERVKEEVNNLKHVRDIDYKRYRLEKIRTTLESYYGVSIEHMRNTLDYWEDKPETLYKGLGFRKNTLKEVSQREIDFQNYLDEVKNILEELD